VTGEATEKEIAAMRKKAAVLRKEAAVDREEAEALEKEGGEVRSQEVSPSPSHGGL
jgi:hypothetical protein